jgi:hypothetical protein
MQPTRNKSLEPSDLERIDSELLAQELANSGQQIPLKRGASISERDGAEELEADQDPNADVMDDSVVEVNEELEGIPDDMERDGGAYADESNMPQEVYSDREFNRLIDSDVHGDSPTAEDHDEVFPTD